MAKTVEEKGLDLFDQNLFMAARSMKADQHWIIHVPARPGKPARDYPVTGTEDDAKRIANSLDEEATYEKR